MAYKPETYEDRADHAEWKVEELESAIFIFFATFEEFPGSAVNNLRNRWEKYLEQTN